METKKFNYEKNSWSIEKSNKLYGLNKWGREYFSINSSGNIAVHPKGQNNQSLDLFELVEELQNRNLKLPLLIRFDDILEDRVNQLNLAFEKAIKNYKYNGKYKGVFPIKCNQQRHVVEKLISCGDKWNFGLEAGSKAELLIALSIVKNPKSLLICNGYKDQKYIETAILARKIGLQPIIVIEQVDEIDRIISASKKLGAAPLIGIRAKLGSESSGHWGATSGEKAKFGLSISNIMIAIDKLKKVNLLKDLKLLHFHVGSQINNIAIIKDAIQEASQIYIELKKLGAPMGHIDVGGGLGIDYDGSQTSSNSSTNYSLQNYANDVVATIKECCKVNRIEDPIIVSESGRAIVSHFSILLFNILGSDVKESSISNIKKNESILIQNLRDTLESINKLKQKSLIEGAEIQEAWNDAIKFKEDVLTAFRLGYIRLEERAIAEQLTWACAHALIEVLPKCISIPKDLKQLPTTLSRIYYANLSVFRSTPDAWAIDQLFPIMPIHRLTEKPNILGHFADITCDSDGKISKFIDQNDEKKLLELHDLNDGEEYIIGIFLGGAYQESMGNLHNLFGSTNSVHISVLDSGESGGYQVDHVIRGDTKSDVLKYMQHKPEEILERVRLASEEAIQKGNLEISDARQLIDHFETSLRQNTYLHE